MILHAGGEKWKHGDFECGETSMTEGPSCAKTVEKVTDDSRLTGELPRPPPDVAEGEFVENPRLTLGAMLKAL